MPIFKRSGFTDLIYDEITKNTPSPEYYLIPGAARARRIIDVDWNRLNDAVKMFLGFPRISGGGPYSRFINRLIPDSIEGITVADRSKQPYLFASQIERVEPIGATGTYDFIGSGIASYQKARLYIIY